MKLFIDDIRMPSDVGFKDDEWLIARNYDEAIHYIIQHQPQRIAFDHDLADCHYAGIEGNEKTGYDIAKKLCELDERHGIYILEDFLFTVHSMNPVGANNIKILLKNHIGRKW